MDWTGEIKPRYVELPDGLHAAVKSLAAALPDVKTIERAYLLALEDWVLKHKTGPQSPVPPKAITGEKLAASEGKLYPGPHREILRDLSEALQSPAGELVEPIIKAALSLGRRVNRLEEKEERRRVADQKAGLEKSKKKARRHHQPGMATGVPRKPGHSTGTDDAPE